MLADAHRILAALVVAGAAIVLLVVIVAGVTRRPLRFALDRAILASWVIVAAGVATGLVILATGGRPADPLHLLYAAVALLVVPVARFWRRLSGVRALAVGVGASLLGVLVLRLFQTG